MNGLTEVVMRRFIPSSIVLILFKVFFFLRLLFHRWWVWVFLSLPRAFSCFLRLLFILLTLVCRNKSRWWWCFFFFSFDFGFTLRQFFGSRQRRRRRLWRPPVHLSDVWPRTKNVFMKKGLKRSNCRSFHDVWVSKIDFRAREREREKDLRRHNDHN